MNIFQSLSFYAPLIICTGVIMFSMFNVIMEKAFVFFIWIFIITFLRIIVFKGIVGSDSTTNSGSEIPSICYTGLTQIFIPKDFTYNELKTLLNSLGYEESNLGKTSGSRVLFLNMIKQSKIRIHKSHPGNILKKYQIVEVISIISSNKKE